jgi:hypothetical protein
LGGMWWCVMVAPNGSVGYTPEIHACKMYA